MENNNNGWDRFTATYGRLIHATARKSGLADMEIQEVLQETTLRVFKHIHTFKPDKTKKNSFRPWLLAIAHKCIVDEIRSWDKAHKMADSTDITQIPADHDAFEEIWDEEWSRNQLTMALEQIRDVVSPKQYQIYDLYVLQEIPAREIAAKLKISVAQVYMAKYRIGSRVDRAINRLNKNNDIQFSEFKPKEPLATTDQ
jgi:RNA polymerase sigma-70 factor (ECF subfamily)